MGFGGEALPGFEARRVQELFSYLLLHRQRFHSRESLAALLWGERSTAQSKKYLRQALWQLQTALDSYSTNEKQSILLVDSEWVQINPEAVLWLDAGLFEQVFATVQGVGGRNLAEPQQQALEEAMQLYRGDLLEGWYQDWCLYQRERLQNMYLAMLDKLMGCCEAHHHYENGIAYGEAILSYDDGRERTHRRLMRLHYLAGNRTLALRQYEHCVTVLDKELGVKPAQSTVALYRHIQADQLHLVAPPPRDAAPGADPPLRSALRRLKQLQSLLSDIQGRLQQEIQAVENVIDGQQ